MCGVLQGYVLAILPFCLYRLPLDRFRNTTVTTWLKIEKNNINRIIMITFHLFVVIEQKTS